VAWLSGASLGLIVACAGCGAGGGDGGSPGTPWAYEIAHLRQIVGISYGMDVLLVVDDSPAMKPFQAALARTLAELRDSGLPGYDAPCAPMRLGVLAAGGDGHLVDQVGTLSWEAGEPVVTHRADTACRIVGPDNLDCLHDPATGSSVALVGFGGSPYPRGLSALGRFVASAEAQEFLRPEATLVVVLISAGEDCGEPGEVAEGIPGMDGRICSYAAKGVGPDGSSSHPDDPLRLPYTLSPVQALHDQLMALKENRTGMVKFAAIVGVADVADPEATAIAFEGAEPSAGVAPACTLTGCEGEGCGALPGTRAIALASAFGLNEGGSAVAGSICEEPWTRRIQSLGEFTSCPNHFNLDRPVLDLGLLAFLVNGDPLPRHSCADLGPMVRCEGPGDPGCECVETYTYFAPGDPANPFEPSPGGTLLFADHASPCDWCPVGPGNIIEFELWYVVAPREN